MLAWLQERLNISSRSMLVGDEAAKPNHHHQRRRRRRSHRHRGV